MRLRLDVETAARELSWHGVLAPGRGVVYDLLDRGAPDLATHLHAGGFGPYGLAPFGFNAPQFPRARRRPGRYTTGGRGTVEFASPLAPLVHAMVLGLRDREVLDWGGSDFYVDDVELVGPPAFASGRARMRTSTPVVLKVGEDAARRRGTAWVLPGDPEFAGCLENNLRRKAETLGLPADIELVRTMWTGPRRSFAVRGGVKTGAAVEVDLDGDPATLRAIWSWGLGLANSTGFGWIASAC